MSTTVDQSTVYIEKKCFQIISKFQIQFPLCPWSTHALCCLPVVWSRGGLLAGSGYYAVNMMTQIN